MSVTGDGLRVELLEKPKGRLPSSPEARFPLKQERK